MLPLLAYAPLLNFYVSVRIRKNMPTVDYSTVPAARSDTTTHLARGLAHQACTWHEHLQRGAMSTQTPQTRSTTEQNSQQDSQYQGYLAMKTQVSQSGGVGTRHPLLSSALATGCQKITNRSASVRAESPT